MSSGETTEHAQLTGGEIPAVVRWSATIGKFVETIGKWASFFILPLVFITVWDVLQRKIMKFVGDYMLEQGWIEARDWMYSHIYNWLPFRSTLLQELEWHFHTALFALVLGYGYIYNRHVRVDLVREKLAFRKQAWIELIGCSVLLIPFCILVGWFAVDYVTDAYTSNEQSASLVGLSHRWAIKAVLVFGLFVALMAGVAVWLQTAFALFSSKPVDFALYTIEREEEKIEKRMMMEAIDGSITDGSNEAKRGDSSKLMSRKITEDVYEHATDSASQKFFYYFGMAIMMIVLILMAHTFNFWSWLL